MEGFDKENHPCFGQKERETEINGSDAFQSPDNCGGREVLIKAGRKHIRSTNVESVRTDLIEPVRLNKWDGFFT